MDSSQKVIIVIPIYKTDLPESDLMSLKRTLHILRNHPFAIACPESLDLGPLSGLLPTVNYREERFKNHYFAGIEGYNSLMLSEEFYQRFSDFEYILLCQTDVFVFKDNLLKWCNKGYDYVGAPWLGSKRTPLSKFLMKLTNMMGKKKKGDRHYFKVGNGGFSLRNVAMMLRILEDNKKNKHDEMGTEDIYFSLVAPRYIPEMKIPDYREAVDFCIDRKPEMAVEINGGKVPFACHGFNKPKVSDFWKPRIDKALASS